MPASKEEIAVFEASLWSFPDFTLEIDGYTWHVHSTVLSRHSKFFEKACNGSFKEANERKIIIHDDCPCTVARMIQFLYFNEYSTPGTVFSSGYANFSKMMIQREGLLGHRELMTTDRHRSRWLISALLYQIADKYEVPSLLERCAVDLGQCLLDPTRNDLELMHTDEPMTLKWVVEFLDISTLKRDKVLSRQLFSAVMTQSEEPLETYEVVKTLVEGDTGLMELVHKLMVKQLDARTKELKQSKAWNLDFLIYIQQIERALARESAPEGTYLFGPPPPQDTFSSELTLWTDEMRVDRARQILEAAIVRRKQFEATLS